MGSRHDRSARARNVAGVCCVVDVATPNQVPLRLPGLEHGGNPPLSFGSSLACAEDGFGRPASASCPGMKGGGLYWFHMVELGASIVCSTINRHLGIREGNWLHYIQQARSIGRWMGACISWRL